MGGKLLLIDGSALAHRSYFAFKNAPLYNSRGENTGAVYGYTNSLLKIMEDQAPSHAAVCFDTDVPTFRHLRFPSYKATRVKMEPEMRKQLPDIREVTEALGVRVIEQEGFEADDLIGTLARKAEKAGYSVYIVSGDKDFLQLVGEKIKVVNPGRPGAEPILYDAEKVIEKCGVPPERIADLLALSGDSVDNVPGVEGIGAKGAALLVRTFGSVEEILGRSHEIEKKALRDRIERSKEKVLLAKELVTIEVNVPVETGLGDLVLKERDAGKLRDLFRRLEFFSLTRRLDVQKRLKEDYVKADTWERLPAIEPGVKRIGLHVAAGAESGIRGMAVCTGEGRCCFVPAELLRSSGDARRWLAGLASSGDVEKVSEDMKAVMNFSREFGADMTGPFMDISLASYLDDPDRRDHSLLYHMERELGLSLPEQGETGTAEETDMFDEELVLATCSRADGALRVEGPLKKRLREGGLIDLYDRIETPLIAVLEDMERSGVLIDVDFLEEMSSDMGRKLDALEQEIYELAGEKFNVRSNKQLAKILFEKLGLPSGRKTKTGFSTSQDLLEKLSLEHELPSMILKYREVHKLKSTYVDVLPGLVSPRTGRIHTTFNQTIASTGRLSSSDPNLQNIPMRSDLGREIRKAFIAGQGSLLLSLDYSQIELRILAHLTGEVRLKEAYKKGADVHRETAALVFGVSPQDVTDEMRDTAKMVNYGLVYGMSAYGLSQRLGMDIDQAKQFTDAYFASLPRVREWTESIVESARLRGYTTTIMGRRRYHRDINSRNQARRELAVRAAINSPIQGSAADMIKAAMVAIHEKLRAMDTAARMIIQIHDELLFEVPEEETEKVREMAAAEMVAAMELDVPVVVEAGQGTNWYQAHR